MPIVDASLGYYRSSKVNSDGGLLTSVIVNSVLNDLFGDITPTMASKGNTTYRKIFVKNDFGSDTILDVRLWKLSNTASLSDEIYLGLGTASDESGSAITYYDPHSYAEGLQLGNMTSGQSLSIWLKRVVTPGKSYKKLNSCIIRCQGKDY
jgi:hypothetical protein